MPAPPASALSRYFTAVGLIACAVVLGIVQRDLLHWTHPYFLYTVAVVLAAYRGGVGPGLVATALGTVAHAFFFLEPRFSFQVADPVQITRLAISVAEGVSVTLLTATLRLPNERWRAWPIRFGLPLLAVGLALAVRLEMEQFVPLEMPYALMHAAVLLSAWGGGQLPGLLATALAALLSSLLLEPRYSFAVASAEQTVRLGLFVAEAVFITQLATKVFAARQQAAALQARAEGAERRARELQKLDSLGRMAAGVTHDFNNLLTAVLGCSEILLDSLPTGDPNRALAEQIFQAGERGRALTRQLLAFSRRQELKPTVLDLNAQLRQFGELLKRVLSGGVRLQLELADSLPKVKIDPNQFDQVILNLAVNARDAMPRGGEVTIRTAVGPAGDVRVSVSDTGLGMPPEVQARLFEPFFTTKPEGVGTGLGLATVHGIVTQSGGTIEVQSAVGRGTTFTVSLPACREG